MAFKVIKLLKREHPDILISNGIFGWSLFNLEIPRVNIYHGTYEGIRRAVGGSLLGNIHKKLVLKQLERLSGKNALKVAVSNNTADELVKYYGFSRKDIEVIEGGTDTNRFSPVSNNEEKMKLRKKYGLPTDKIVCTYTASLTYRKGWDIVQRLSKKFQDFFFLCTTKNFRYDNIMGLEVPYDIIHEVYQLGDIYLYPSRYDGFSLGLIEAMSCGLPFVGFPIGFCRDLKDNHLFSECIAEDEKSFVELLRKLSGDEWLRLDVGIKCRRFAENHNWELVAKRMESVLKKAIFREAAINPRQGLTTKKKLETTNILSELDTRLAKPLLPEAASEWVIKCQK